MYSWVRSWGEAREGGRRGRELMGRQLQHLKAPRLPLNPITANPCLCQISRLPHLGCGVGCSLSGVGDWNIHPTFSVSLPNPKTKLLSFPLFLKVIKQTVWESCSFSSYPRSLVLCPTFSVMQVLVRAWSRCGSWRGRDSDLVHWLDQSQTSQPEVEFSKNLIIFLKNQFGQFVRSHHLGEEALRLNIYCVSIIL